MRVLPTHGLGAHAELAAKRKSLPKSYSSSCRPGTLTDAITNHVLPVCSCKVCITAIPNKPELYMAGNRVFQSAGGCVVS